MKIVWENNGEANGEGRFAATIDLEDGSGVSRFEGVSHKEIADKLLESQANATAEIRRLHKEARKPAEPKPIREFKPRALSADERMQVARDITDPARAPEAIATVVEAAVGAPLAEVSDGLREDENEKAYTEAMQASTAFRESTPDYFPCPHNTELMVNYMELKGLNPRAQQNYADAYATLQAQHLLVVKPAEETPEVASRNASVTRPRAAGSASGLRNADTPGAASHRPAAQKYTRAQIETMPRSEYNAKLSSEPGFRELVDKLYSQPAVQ